MPDKNTIRGAFADGLRAAGRAIQRVLERSYASLTKGDRFDRTTRIAYAAALTVAASTTWFGMNAILHDASPHAGILVMAITALFSALLFFGQNWALELFAANKSFAKRAVGLTAYVAFAFISIIFAFTFWWSLIASHPNTVQNAQSGAQVVLVQADRVEADLQSVARTTANLAAYSKERSDTEAKSGGTCDLSHGTRGPRAIMREQDAATFGAASAYVAPLAAQTSLAIADLRKSVAPVTSAAFADADEDQRQQTINAINEKIDEVGRQVSTADGDQQLAQMQTQFGQRLAQEAASTTIGDQTFTCHDATLRNDLQGAANAISALQRAPSLEGLRLSFSEGGRANLLAFNRVLNTFTSGFSSAPTGHSAEVAARQEVARGDGPDQTLPPSLNDAGALTQTDWGLFGLASFVDGLIALTGFFKRRSMFDSVDDLMDRARAGAGVRQMVETLNETNGGLRALIDPYAVVLYGDDYLIVPVNAQMETPPEGAENAPVFVKNLATILRQGRLAMEFAPHRPLRRMLLRGLDYNTLRVNRRLLALPAPEGRASEPSKGFLGRLKAAGRGALQFMKDTWWDAANDERSRRYRYFRVKPDILDLVTLSQVNVGREHDRQN